MKLAQLRPIVVSLGILALSATPSLAIQVFWDNNGSTAGTGGTSSGTWSTSSSTWNSSNVNANTNVPGPWVNGFGLDAVFSTSNNNAGGSPIISVSGTVETNSIFIEDPGSATISDLVDAAPDSLAIGAGGVTVGTGSRSVTFGGTLPVTLTASQTWTAAPGNSAGSSFSVNTAINQGANTLEITGGGIAFGTGATGFTGNGTIWINGTGTGAVIPSLAGQFGTGTVRLSAGNLRSANTPPEFVTGNNLLIDGNITFIAPGGNNRHLNFSGGGTISGSPTITFNDNNNGVAGGTKFTTNALTLNSNVTFAGTGFATIDSTLNEDATPRSVTKIDSGTVTLGGNNSYTGGTNLNGGILSLNHSGALGTIGTITFGGGLLQHTANNLVDYSSRFSNAAGQTFNIDIGGNNGVGLEVTYATGLNSTGGLNKLGQGTLILSGASTYTGTTIATRGILKLGVNDALPVDTTLQMGSTSNEPTLDLSGFHQTVANLTIFTSGSNVRTITNTSGVTSNFTVGAGVYDNRGVITGNVALVKSGAGMFTLGGAVANTYAGGTTVNDGTLQLTSASALGNTTASLTVNGGNLNLNGNSITVGLFSGTGGTVLNNGAGNISLTFGDASDGDFSGTVADNSGSGGTLGLVKVGAGTTTLSGSNTYTGDTGIDVGTLAMANGSALGTGTGAGGSFAPGWTLINSGGDGSGAASLAVSNNISSAEVIYITPRTINSAPLIINESGTNTLTGVIANDDGDMTAGPNQFAIQSNAGLLTIAGNVKQDVPGTGTLTLRGAGDGEISGTIEQPETNFYYNTPVTGNVWNVAKEDGGTWTLSGVNTYTGTTGVNGGSLLVNGLLAAASTVTVASGATLGGNGSILGSVIVDGTYAPGNSIDQQDLGDLTISSIGTWEVEYDGSASLATDLSDVLGAITLADDATISFVGIGDALTEEFYIFATYGDGGFIGNPLNISLLGDVLDNYYVDYSYNGNNIALVQIPEPGAFILLGIGILGLGMHGRRKGR